LRVFALILAACAAGTLNWSGPAHSAPPSAAAVTEERLPHISVQSIGTGSPVILIPGLSSPRAVWAGIAPKLARNHQVLLVQVNGFAGEDAGANLKPGVLGGIVEDLHGYIASHKLGRVRVVGHSMGGLATLMFAKAHPDEVEQAMVVDALPFFAVLMDPLATADSVKPAAEMMRAKVAAAYGKPADLAAAEASVKSLALKPESIAKMKAWAAAADPRVTAQALYEDLTTDLRPELAGITTPVTLIVPWTDTRFGEERTLAFYKRQYAALPKANYVGIGDAGHFVMLDQPAAFETAVEAFVK
jgi:pimeloyl-ACP methyl ester carboxylesterase